jgi:hypothetical protein
MGSSALNKSQAVRASAILTTGAVATDRVDLNNANSGSDLSVQVDFTLGSLTNVILKPYVSMDGTTYYQLASAAASTLESVTLTADDTRAWRMPVPAGWKWFRLTAQGTGTVTSSLLALTVRYSRRGAQ